MREELYYPICVAAVEVAQEPPETRERVLAEAIALLVNEVESAVLNTALIPRFDQAVFDQLAYPKARLHVVEDEHHSVRVGREAS